MNSGTWERRQTADFGYVFSRHVCSDVDRPATASDTKEHRRQLLSDGCRELSLNVTVSDEVWYEMYFDDQMDYVYCLVGKVACTNWKRTLMMLTGKISQYQRPEQLPFTFVFSYRPVNPDKYVDRLEKLPLEYRDWRFKSSRYFTFLFVREPLERLVSAYRDKLLEDPHRRLDAEIVRQYRPHDYKPSIKHYHVTFAEFVRYVLDEYAAGKVLNRHWTPQNQLCRVCQYRWDFIGHFETLREDADYVVKKLKSRIMEVGHRRRVANIKFPADSRHRKSGHFLQPMYASLPAADVQALYKLYAVDYALFGFKHPNVTGFT